MAVKGTGSRVRPPGSTLGPSTHRVCVNSGKLPVISVLRFPFLYNENDNSTCFVGVCLSESIHVKALRRMPGT